MATREALNICSLYLAGNMEKIASREQNVEAKRDQSANCVSHKAGSNSEQLWQ